MMILSTLATVVYLLVNCNSLIVALPAGGTDARDPGFGYDQTTQRNRQTTTIDYDLADFDEFGNDPGMYDAAGSPDAINFADETDQGHTNQQGHSNLDTGQSLFEPLGFFTTGIVPINSGGISGEVKETEEKQSEGGPADEGLYGNSVKQVQQGNQIKNVENNNEYTDIGREFNPSGYENDVTETPSDESQNNGEVTITYRIADQDLSENDKIKINDKTAQNIIMRTSGEKVTSTNDKYGSHDPMNMPSESLTSDSTLTKLGNTDFTQDHLYEDTSTAFGSNESVSDTSVQKESKESGRDDNSANNKKFDAYNTGSVSQTRKEGFSEDAYSIEVVSGEDIDGKLQSGSLGSSDGNKGKYSPRDHVTSNAASLETSKENFSSVSSDENAAYDTSDEISHNTSSQQDDLQQTSGGESSSSSSADENISSVTSNEVSSISNSDENPTSQEGGVDVSSNSTEMPDSKQSSDEVSSANSDKDVDTDIDNDTDNISTENDVNDFSGPVSMESKHSLKDDTTKSTETGESFTSTQDASTGSAEETSVGGNSGDTSNNLANCFSSSREEGEYCSLLRSLHTICSTQFKKECGNEYSIKDTTSKSKSSTAYAHGLSSESQDGMFPDSDESSISDGHRSKRDTPKAMTVESIENLSESFEKSSGMLEIITLIRNACESVCGLAESRSGTVTTNEMLGTDTDIDSSESSDEDDLNMLSDESFIDSEEDTTGSLDVTLSGAVSEEQSSGTDVSNAGSDEISAEKISTEIYESSASFGSTENTSSGELGGDLRFGISMASENLSD